MHQQIRTSPMDPQGNVRAILDALAAAEVSVDGIGMDFEHPHVRTVVDHDTQGDNPWTRAWDALKDAGLQPEARPAVTVALSNTHGQLRQVLERLTRQGFAIESVLVLGTHDGDGKVRVSIGVRKTMGNDWEDESTSLGESLVAG